jgi:luciferase family oxidoreductase group 1
MNLVGFQHTLIRIPSGRLPWVGPTFNQTRIPGHQATERTESRFFQAFFISGVTNHAVATGPVIASIMVCVEIPPFVHDRTCSQVTIVKPLSTIPLSILDLSPICQGGAAADSFRNTLDLAQHAERWGYQRYWLAEHHSIPGVASAATSVLIGYVAAGTSRIRVGSGGIMLPNHAPLVIAEQFGTLASLYPGRIDLGLGRAPGGDQRTARALGRTQSRNGDTFPQDLEELMGYFRPGGPGNGVHAVPGEGLEVPIWLLGSSDFSARLAGQQGLRFAFASHFAPDHLLAALGLYRAEFQPSDELVQPHAAVAVNVVVADADDEARRQFTSVQQAFLNLVRGTPGLLPPAVDSMRGRWNPLEQQQVERMTQCSAVGSPDTVQRALTRIAEATAADELILVSQLENHTARLRSYELASRLAPAKRETAASELSKI